MIGLLAVLVVLEAIPTALWARSYLSPVTALPVAPAPAISTPPPLAATIPPCEVAPSGAAPAPTPASGSARTDAAVAASAQPIAAGLFSVVAPLPLNVYARGRLIGTSEADTLMLPLGSHELEFVNEAAGYRTTRNITVQAGRKNLLRIDPPNGTLHVNAVPWAEVLMDNQRLGETPIGNAQVPIGNHELVFRHPELGERRVRVMVTLKEPARVSMDLRK
jgi:hypothetical protein